MKNPDFKMFDFLEMTPDFVCVADKDGFFKKVNPAVIQKLGYTEEELFTLPISTFIHPEDRDFTKQERTKLLNGKGLLNLQNRYVTKEGNIVWLEWTSIYISDKDLVFAIAKDISARKKIEIEVEEKYKKFKSLATHFKKTIEKDKKYLAIELHAELAQLASVVKMDINWIRNKTTRLNENTNERIDHALAIVDLLINSIRRISFSVSPTMLADLGLSETLKWHCKEFSILNGIPCEFESAFDEADLSYEIKMDFFRISQEALTNIMYHAQANKVMINIEDTGNGISLCITDNGKGFDQKNLIKSNGLTNMKKRAISINAEMAIQSAAGKGTKICVKVAKQPNKEPTSDLIQNV